MLPWGRPGGGPAGPNGGGLAGASAAGAPGAGTDRVGLDDPVGSRPWARRGPVPGSLGALPVVGGSPLRIAEDLPGGVEAPHHRLAVTAGDVGVVAAGEGAIRGRNHGRFGGWCHLKGGVVVWLVVHLAPRARDLRDGSPGPGSRRTGMARRYHDRGPACRPAPGNACCPLATTSRTPGEDLLSPPCTRCTFRAPAFLGCTSRCRQGPPGTPGVRPPLGFDPEPVARPPPSRHRAPQEQNRHAAAPAARPASKMCTGCPCPRTWLRGRPEYRRTVANHPWRHQPPPGEHHRARTTGYRPTSGRLGLAMAKIRILDVVDEASFDRIPPCADPRFDHRTCDYWEEPDRGSKRSRPDWLRPAEPRTRPAPADDNPFRPTKPGWRENPFAPSEAERLVNNPFAPPAERPSLAWLADEASAPPTNPFTPRRSPPAAAPTGPRKLGLLSRGLTVFGSYAKVLLVDEEPAAYAQFGPLSAYPRALRVRELYPQLPDSPLPAVITCIAVTRTARRRGLGRRLVEVVCADLAGRGFAAVEAYPEVGARPDETSAATPGFWVACGFRVAVNDPHFPVVRRELG